MISHRIVGPVAVATLALALAACTGGGGAEVPEDDADGGPDEVTRPELAPVATGIIDELWQGSVDAAAEEAAAVLLVQHDEKIAECMAGHGFEYTSVTAADIPRHAADVSFGEPTAGDRATFEFAEVYGYGMTTSPDGDGVARPAAEPGAIEDLNKAYVEAMSDAERTAYMEALGGVTPVFASEEEASSWEPTLDQLGCWGWAESQVYGDGGRGGDVPDDGAWAELEAEIVRLEEAIGNDPRVTAAVADWSACMADAGYPGLADLEAAQLGILDAATAIWEESGLATLGEDAPAEDRAAAQQAFETQMSALAADEIATAVADLTCRAEVGYQDVFNEVNLAMQQEFYDMHQAELDAYVAAISSRG